MEAICTIITGNYGHYALALHDSILKFNHLVNFYIFVTEGKLAENIKCEIDKRKNIDVLSVSDFTDFEITKRIYEKYALINHDALRWSMKPVVMSYLLNSKYDRVIYVDCDIHFFNDFNFLFEALKTKNVLLSPHWRSSNPLLDLDNFKLNFLDGIFNGGFVGASKLGVKALDYWAHLCLFNCEVRRQDGFFVDQKYLDLLPSRFENVESIRHMGCNVANWNQIDCKRILNDDGQILINNHFPIIFIHFTKSFFRGVLKENDTFLLPHLEIYNSTLLKYNSINVIEDFLEKEIKSKSKKNKQFPFLIKLYTKTKKVIFNKNF